MYTNNFIPLLMNKDDKVYEILDKYNTRCSIKVKASRFFNDFVIKSVKYFHFMYML